MKVEDAEFWKYILLENADYLFKKKKAQGVVSAINIDELVKEVIDQLGRNLGKVITEETKELVYQFLQEECIGTDFWKLKEGFILPAYYLADLFLIKANELFRDESRRYRGVPSLEELIELVSKQLHASFDVQSDNRMKADLRQFLEKLCSDYKYFRKIQDKYLMFDESGRVRLEKIHPFTKK